MLPELTKLKISAVHCKHLSTHLVTGNGRQDALVTPGYELSVTTLNISTLVYVQLIVKRKIVLHGGRSWKRLRSHSWRDLARHPMMVMLLLLLCCAQSLVL